MGCGVCVSSASVSVSTSFRCNLVMCCVSPVLALSRTESGASGGCFLYLCHLGSFDWSIGTGWKNDCSHPVLATVRVACNAHRQPLRQSFALFNPALHFTWRGPQHAHSTLDRPRVLLQKLQFLCSGDPVRASEQASWLFMGRLCGSSHLGQTNPLFQFLL